MSVFVSFALKVSADDEELQMYSHVIKQLNTEPKVYVESPEVCISAGYPPVKIAIFHLHNDTAKEFAKAHTVLKDFIKICLINRIDIVTGDTNQSANLMHKHQHFPHFLLSNFAHVLRQMLAVYNDISGEEGINAFLETSSRALDLRASYLNDKYQYDAVNRNEMELEDIQQPPGESAPDLDSMLTAVLCWHVFPQHIAGRQANINKKSLGFGRTKQLTNLYDTDDLPTGITVSSTERIKWLTNCSLMNAVNDQNWHLPLGVCIQVRHQKANLSHIGVSLREERQRVHREQRQAARGETKARDVAVPIEPTPQPDPICQQISSFREKSKISKS